MSFIDQRVTTEGRQIAGQGMDDHGRARRPGPGWLALAALCVLVPAAAGANSSGLISVPGHSGKQSPNTTCNNCHGGGAAPDVAFEGPTELLPGEVATFRFTVESNAQSQRSAGFNVAASGGMLGVIAGQGAQLVEFPSQSGQFELTHAGSKANTNGRASWQFTWTAPIEAGAYVLFGSGNSVNRSGNTLGDRSTSDVYNVFVVAPADTPTETPTAEPTATETVEPTSTRRETPTSTATRTSSATPSPTPTPTATEDPTPAGPSPGDANCDGAINAADLAAELRLLDELGGEVGSCAFADADCDGGIDEDDITVLFSRIFGGPVPPSCD